MRGAMVRAISLTRIVSSMARSIDLGFWFFGVADQDVEVSRHGSPSPSSGLSVMWYRCSGRGSSGSYAVASPDDDDRKLAGGDPAPYG